MLLFVMWFGQGLSGEMPLSDAALSFLVCVHWHLAMKQEILHRSWALPRDGSRLRCRKCGPPWRIWVVAVFASEPPRCKFKMGIREAQRRAHGYHGSSIFWDVARGRVVSKSQIYVALRLKLAEAEYEFTKVVCDFFVPVLLCSRPQQADGLTPTGVGITQKSILIAAGNMVLAWLIDFLIDSHVARNSASPLAIGPLRSPNPLGPGPLDSFVWVRSGCEKSRDFVRFKARSWSINYHFSTCRQGCLANDPLSVSFVAVSKRCIEATACALGRSHSKNLQPFSLWSGDARRKGKLVTCVSRVNSAARAVSEECQLRRSFSEAMSPCWSLPNFHRCPSCGCFQAGRRR